MMEATWAKLVRWGGQGTDREPMAGTQQEEKWWRGRPRRKLLVTLDARYRHLDPRPWATGHSKQSLNGKSPYLNRVSG